MAVDWTQLPPDLLEIISKNLKIYTDYLHFQSVCHTWRSSIPKTPRHLPPQLPWLMFPQSEPHKSRRAFFNLPNKKTHFLNLPEISHNKRLCGSSHGWFIILDESPTILLLNPLTRAKNYLPPLSTFPHIVSFSYSDIGREYAFRSLSGNRYTHNLREMRDFFIKKVVLSSSPLKDSDFVALAILNQTGNLAYCRNGDRCWTILEDARSYCEDVIYYNGLFYAVDKYGLISVCDFRGDLPRFSFIETPRQLSGDMQYLVRSGGEFLLVTRFVGVEFESEPDQHLSFYRTMRFEVFRLDWNAPRWERVKNLGDQMLFLGANSSLSFSTLDFPGCEGNCIYYTDDYSETNYDGDFAKHDLGIFKLWNERIEELPQNSYPWSHCSSPIWVTPNPC